LLPWILLAVVLLSAATIRFRLIDVPFERDEGEYAYAGQLMLHGVAPFKLAYNMKLPGTYAAYAASLAVFGESIAGARIGLVLVNGATIFFLFLLARKLFGAGAGVAAAAAFAFLSLSKSMLGPFGHATHFVVLPAVAGAWVLVPAVESGRRRLLAASGVLLGIAVLMKQTGFVFPLFALGWLGWTGLRGGGGPKRWLADSGALLLGILAPIAAMVAALAWAGVLDRFYFWVVRYASEYASLMSLGEGLQNLRETAADIASEHALILVLACAGLVVVAVPRFGILRRSFLLGFLALSLLGVCPGLYFRGHYFLLALPAVSLLVGAAYRGVETLASSARARAVAGAVVILACIEPVVAQADVYLRAPPDRVSHEIYGENPFPESIRVARYIRERTHPDDTVAVLGSEPQIYFYSGRRSATGYLYAYPLMELQPLAGAMQEEMIRQIEAARPAYVVFVRVATSWLVRSGSERMILAWADRYLSENYDFCGEAAIVGPDRTDYFWDERAPRPRGDYPGLMVFRRKGFAPAVPARPAEGSRPWPAKN
jgi:hypothetical protein